MYTLYVSENSAYMDADSPPSARGVFATWDEAIAEAREIVDRSLKELAATSLDTDELFRLYALFGEDAFIGPPSKSSSFSAWDYAKDRAREICARQAGGE